MKMNLSLGAAVKSTRAEMGISQEELADRAGLHRTYISDIERGSRNPSLGSIEKLAQALELPISMLFAKAGESGSWSPFIEILLIEDDPHDVELTLRAFQKVKLTNVMQVVRDGAEALDFLFARGAYAVRRGAPLPGVILLDLYLPKINGLDVLRRIKTDRRTRDIPVIVLTVSDRERDIASCREMGVENYIVKPVDFRKFSEVTPRLPFQWALVKAS